MLGDRKEFGPQIFASGGGTGGGGGGGGGGGCLLCSISKSSIVFSVFV